MAFGKLGAMGRGFGHLGSLGGAAAYDPAAVAIFNAFTTPPTTARKASINTLVVSLKSAGVWSLLDCLYLTAAADSQAALINWKNPGTFNLTAVSSPTFVADRGFTGNGTSSYLNSNYTPSTAGGVLTQNSAHYSGWSLTDLAAVSSSQRLVGNTSTSNGRTVVIPFTTGNSFTSLINDTSGVSAASTTSLGHFIGNRSGASAQQLYFNGASIGSGTVASATLSGGQVCFGRDTTNFASLQIAAGSIGASLTSVQAAALYTALRTYLIAIGVTLPPFGANGVWTWYNDPRAITVSGTTYAGMVTTAGGVRVTKMNDTENVLSAAFEVDDHDNPSLVQLPGGRMFAAYSKHSTDTAGIRYRVTTNALPDVSAWNSEVTISNGGTATSYANPVLLNDGVLRVFYRSGAGAQRTQRVATAPATDVEAGTASWSTTTIFQTTNERPYMVARKTAADRVDFLMTNGHPNEVATSLYHVYMKVISGVDHYYKSDGTEIVGLPIDIVTQGTLIADTTGGRNWNWDIALGADGNPRVLFTKYPSSTGARDVVFSDIEYWHGRWTGSAWTNFSIASGQVSLYANENHYAAGLCFDGNTTDSIFMSLTNGSINQISEWSINESAPSVTKLRDVVTSTRTQIRPYSPSGHGVDAAVLWAEGTYTTYTNYNTTIKVSS